MTRNETQILKGVAFLLMLFLHLFCRLEHFGDYNTLINICLPPPIKGLERVLGSIMGQGVFTFEYILSRATGPVMFFLILGGIGLFSVYNLGRGDLRSNYKRAKRLYGHYWIIITVFVAIAIFVRPARYYYKGVLDIIGNYSGFNTSWNGECWFLLPYVIVMMISPYLFRLVNKYRAFLVLTPALFLFLFCSFLLHRYGEEYINAHKLASNLNSVLLFLFPFLLGAYSVKCKFWGAISRLRRLKSYYLWLLFIVLIIFRCCFKTSAFHVFYSWLFMVLFISCSRWRFIDRFLGFIGTHCLNLWLIHTWFCYYLFHDFIYGFRYPVLIYGVTLLLSLAVSLVVNWIFNHISGFLSDQTVKKENLR